MSLSYRSCLPAAWPSSPTMPLRAIQLMAVQRQRQPERGRERATCEWDTETLFTHIMHIAAAMPVKLTAAKCSPQIQLQGYIYIHTCISAYSQSWCQNCAGRTVLKQLLLWHGNRQQSTNLELCNKVEAFTVAETRDDLNKPFSCVEWWMDNITGLKFKTYKSSSKVKSLNQTALIGAATAQTWKLLQPFATILVGLAALQYLKHRFG